MLPTRDVELVDNSAGLVVDLYSGSVFRSVEGAGGRTKTDGIGNSSFEVRLRGSCSSRRRSTAFARFLRVYLCWACDWSSSTSTHCQWQPPLPCQCTGPWAAGEFGT